MQNDAASRRHGLLSSETVYGLGADARSDEAVRSIYAIKGRPSDNPLIVHVHKDYALNSLVFDDMPYAKKLRDAFLPVR